MAKPAKSAKSQSDSFIPDEAISSGASRYLKLDEETKFRIISKPIVGWLEWVDKKPIRHQIEDEPEVIDEENKPKKFMTVVVVDRNDEDKIKILELTQQSVIKAIKALTANPDWGTPFSYDINVKKTGEGLKTKYAVTPSPKKPLSKEAIKAAQSTTVTLDELFEGNDPWKEDGAGTELYFK